jgi:hypothetical protein
MMIAALECPPSSLTLVLSKDRVVATSYGVPGPIWRVSVKCAYRFYRRIYETYLPQLHYLAFFESIRLIININEKLLPIGNKSLTIIQVVSYHFWGTILTSTWPLDEFQIAHAAEDVIREHGNEALTNADDWINKLNSEGFKSVANTWELIREFIIDKQESDTWRGPS